MSPGQNVTQEVRAKRHPVGQGKASQGKMSPKAKCLRAKCHQTLSLSFSALSECIPRLISYQILDAVKEGGWGSFFRSLFVHLYSTQALTLISDSVRGVKATCEGPFT